MPSDAVVETRGSFWNGLREKLSELITVGPNLSITRINGGIRISFTKPNETEIVKSTSNTPNGNGLFPGKIMRDFGEGLVEFADCWITTYE